MTCKTQAKKNLDICGSSSLHRLAKKSYVKVFDLLHIRFRDMRLRFKDEFRRDKDGLRPSIGDGGKEPVGE